jgi:hypothetical protein
MSMKPPCRLRRGFILALSSSTIFAGTYARGVWIRLLSEMTGAIKAVTIKNCR